VPDHRPAAGHASLTAGCFRYCGAGPVAIADALNRAHVESRAGCHCATLAYHDLGLDPPASCRLSFALYNTYDEVDTAVDALARIVSDS